MKENLQERKKKYNKIIQAALNVCKIKGWLANLDSKDENYNFASIHVSKDFDAGEVTGMLEIILNESGLKYSIQKTSFYGYGLSTLLDSISAKLHDLGWSDPNQKKDNKIESPKPSEILKTIIKNFDKCARQINRRHQSRPTIKIEDEYDAQDLLHTILRAFFDDVRAEEYTPSYAGSSSRVDFLLKKEKIVIEVKFASEKLKEKQIADQLIVDIKRYQSHPDCEQLNCLVYDPNGEVRNPASLENDLSGTHNKLNVRVYVVPN